MSKRPITPEDLLRFEIVSSPLFNPSGSQILFGKKTVTSKLKSVNQLFTVSLDGTVKQWTQGEKSASSGQWSPDGKSIAFVAGREGAGGQIYLLSAEGGEAKALTNLPEGSIGEFKWSANSKHLAFTFRPTSEPFTEAAQKAREKDGGATPPVTVSGLWYRLDGDGTFGDARYRLYTLKVETGESKEIYAACPLGMYDFDWSPVAEELIVGHTVSKRPLLDPEDTGLFRLTLDGKVFPLKGLSPGPKSSLKFSPDGKWVAYAGNDELVQAWGSQNTKLFIVAPAGGHERCLSDKTDYDMETASLSDTREGAGGANYYWKLNSDGLYAELGWHGTTYLAQISLNGDIELLTKGEKVLTLGNLNSAGTLMAVTAGGPTALQEIATVDVATGEIRQLTNFNAWVGKELELSVPEPHWVAGTDGVKVHTWVMRPPRAKAGEVTPGILEVHGGPHTQYAITFFHEMQVLAAQGYTVVFSNPRGSKGYGEAHCMAINKNWGVKDWEDIQAVTEWMKKLPGIDAHRISIMGGSYGGFMTNWAIGHSKAYKAAITDRCVSNLVSFAGNSDFPLNAGAYFGGEAWGDLEEIRELWRQSPIAYFKGVSTPTLVIHSEGDLRCNIEQGEQVFHALQAQGVPSRFVRYPRETSHGMSRGGPADLRIHRLNEFISWWDAHL